MLLLENENIKLRALEPEDLSLLYDWENNTEIWNVGNTINPFSRYILKQYIENSHNEITESGQLRLMIDIKGDKLTTIGTVDLFDMDFINKRAAVGILIADFKYHNLGYASETLDILHQYCRTKLVFSQLYCNIDVDNTNSINLFHSKGYENTGIKKKWKKTYLGWQDVLFFQYFL